MFMKTSIVYVVMVFLTVLLFQGCGPSEEELRQQELARQDSLQQVYQAEMEQMRLDSLEQAERENTEPEEEEGETPEFENSDFEYSDNGYYAVQIEAWRSEEKARDQAELWKKRDFEHAFVVEYGNPEKGDTWYRVRLGRFDSLEMAENFKTMLETDYSTQSWISETTESQLEEAGAGN